MSKTAKALEIKIKETYGQKRGRAMIAKAKQDVDYQLGSDNDLQLAWIQEYEKKLQAAL